MGTTLGEHDEQPSPLEEIEQRITDYLEVAETQQELAARMRDLLEIVADVGKECADALVTKKA